MTDIIFSLIFVALQIVFLWGTWGIMTTLNVYLPALLNIAANTKPAKYVFEYQVVYWVGRSLVGELEIEALNEEGQKGWEIVQINHVDNGTTMACTMKRRVRSL